MDAAKLVPNEKPLRTMAHRVALGIVFVRHRSQAPRDEDWQQFLADIGAQMKPGQPLQVLVKTDDAGPNSVQRNQINRLAQSKGASLRVAVMSNSRLVRGIITAFSWMGSLQIRSIEPTDYKAALAFLGAAQVSPGEAARLIAEIEATVG
jgi:hypothetical protein